MLEGQEWDSISSALAHCELYMSLVKLFAFSVFLKRKQSSKPFLPH